MPVRTTLPPAVFLWDFDSARVKDYQLQPLVKRIRDYIAAEIGQNSEKSFLVCCDVRKLPASTTRALNKIRGLDVVHLDSNQPGTPDEKIKQKMHQVDIDYRDQNGVITLISGNGELSYFLSNMGRSGWKVVVFHDGDPTEQLLECVDHHQDFRNYIAEIEVDETVEKPRSEISTSDTSYILVTNIPKKMDADEAVVCLQMATDEFCGKVSYFNQLTGESVLTYCSLESEAKGTTALSLSKSLKSILGLSLSVLAIKDPCGELSRMKFTVQQLGEVRQPVGRASSTYQPTPRYSNKRSSSPSTADSSDGILREPQDLSYSDEELSPHSDVSTIRDYATVVKKGPISQERDRDRGYEEFENLAPDDDGAIVTNGYRPFFQKPAMQCFHWDNTTHISQSLRDCKFWHPRERCRFYPQCMMGADSCGYAHPFCGVYCECEAEMRDNQKNHRLKAPAYIRNALKANNESKGATL